MLEPSGNYPNLNLIRITPADRRPKSEEYNIDFGDSFGKKTVCIKTLMRLEDFDMPVNMNMYAMSDEICEYLGLTTKAPNNKPKWIEGLPAVKKVEVYNNRVVKVTFVDGTFTKSVCSENDIFDLDVGITVCAMKRLLGTSSENATREYNRFMNHVHAVMEKNENEKVAAQAQKAADKAKKRKIELKKAAKKLKAKEEQIDIYKQAILRAQKETFSQFEDGGSI